MKAILLALLVALATQPVTALLGNARPGLPVRLLAADTGVHGRGMFDQYIDHANPGLGTFQQRFFYTTEFWEGPGSPVFLFTPGEDSAEYFQGFLDEDSIMGQYAEATGGATIVLEHRYWGTSIPFSILDTQNLTYLNLRNSLADFAHFARAVDLPFDHSGKSSPENAPWIFVGGSYGGLLAAWIQKFHPGVFWASHASSAPVQMMADYWKYFTSIEKGMPQNCSADALLIADHVTAVGARGSKTEMHELQDLFGLAEVEHFDDFAITVGTVFDTWQSQNPGLGYSDFFQMCDTIEGARAVNVNAVYLNSTNTTTTGLVSSTTTTGLVSSTTTASMSHDNHTSPWSPSGIGLEKALANLAAWYKNEVLPGYCASWPPKGPYPEWADTLSVGCYDSHNASSPVFTDWSVDNSRNDRQWMWILCNEPFGLWQVGPPPPHRSLMSRIVSPDYFQRQCALMFPPTPNGTTYGSAHGARTTDSLNELTGGWNYDTNNTRVLWTNGEFDPWLHLTLASPERPGGPLVSSPTNPIFLIPGAIHCHDLYTPFGRLNPDIAAVQNASIAIMVQWVADYMDSRNQTSI